MLFNSAYKLLTHSMQIFCIAIMWSNPLIKLTSLWGIQKLKMEYIIIILKTTTYGDTYEV